MVNIGADKTCPFLLIFSLTPVLRSRIYARPGFAGKSFGLVLSLNEHIWRTA